MGNSREYMVCRVRDINEDDAKTLAQDCFVACRPFTGYANRNSDEEIIDELKSKFVKLNDNPVKEERALSVSGSVTTASYDSILDFLEERGIIQCVIGVSGYSLDEDSIDSMREFDEKLEKLKKLIF